MMNGKSEYVLSAAVNFRDLGGYPTRAGGRVRRGKIFRSNSLTQLSDQDHRVIDALGLQTVCDLRAQEEAARSPGPWSNRNIRVIRSHKADMRDILASLFALGDAGEAEWRAAFRQFYTTLPELYADEFAAIFGVLAAGDVPMLINCSAGKDRTGVACALILMILDVPLEQVIGDYLESGLRLHRDGAFKHMLPQHAAGDFERLPAHAKSLLMGVDEAALQGALATIDSAYGSVRAYVEGRLGLGAGAVDAIRGALVGTDAAATGSGLT